MREPLVETTQSESVAQDTGNLSALVREEEWWWWCVSVCVEREGRRDEERRRGGRGREGRRGEG